MKICILGNSHVAALKTAWDELIDNSLRDKYNITFFAERGNGLKELVSEGNALKPNNDTLKKTLMFTSNGLSMVECDKYDVFLIYGVGIEPYFLSESFYSKEVIKRSIQDTYNESILGYKLLTQIRESVLTKVYLGHSPLKSFKEDQKLPLSWNEGQYTAGIELVNQTIFRGLNCELVCQPKETCINNYRFTKAEFSKGSKRLAVNNDTFNEVHDNFDSIHMNGEFGKLWLESFLTNLNNS